MTDRDPPDAGTASRPKIRAGKAQERAARAARLAERLRANLGRRKQQLRDRRDTEAEAARIPDPPESEPTS